MRTPSAVVALILILLSSFLVNLFCPVIAQVTSSPDVYVGVYLAYGDVGEAKGLIDQVYSYTNLFIIGTNQIALDTDKLNETAQYAVDKGLSFIKLGIPPLSQEDLERLQQATNESEWDAYKRETVTEFFLNIHTVYMQPRILITCRILLMNVDKNACRV